eukprot:UN30460
MAFGGAAPEIVIAVITTMQTVHSTEDDSENISLGITTIFGSGLLAFSLLPAAVGLYSPDPTGKGLELKRRPLIRDLTAYLLSLLVLFFCILGDPVPVWQPVILVVLYVLYIIVIFSGRPIRMWWRGGLKGLNDEEEPIKNATDNENI